MKLTKDEARILGMALSSEKYELIKRLLRKEDRNNLFEALEFFQTQLEDYGIDLRRQGRKSQNHFSDMLKRYEKKFTTTLKQDQQ